MAMRTIMCFPSISNQRLFRDLTPIFREKKATNWILDENHPDEILVGMNVRDDKVFDMYRVHLSTGAFNLGHGKSGRRLRMDNRFKLCNPRSDCTHS